MDDKSKLFNLKNFIKQENGRLSSLTVPRDLSLGGSKPKKLYTPNLNAVRNKNKHNPNVQKHQKTQNKRTPREHNKNANSGRFVQSHGIFSEGTANIKRPTIYSDKHASIREQETSSGMIKPKLGNSWNIDLKEESGVVDDLLACDEDSSSDNDGDYEPIVLPLVANIGGFMNNFKVKKDLDVPIKKELSDEINGNSEPSCSTAKVNNNFAYTPSSFSNGKLYDDDHVSLSLVKFPDCMPGKGFDDDNKIIDYTVDQMNEGKIGKILLRKSGRVDVIIGKTYYTLDAVEAAHFTEELMCTPQSEEMKRDQSFTSLGTVNEKFIISPIWPNLLPKKRKLA